MTYLTLLVSIFWLSYTDILSFEGPNPHAIITASITEFPSFSTPPLHITTQPKPQPPVIAPLCKTCLAGTALCICGHATGCCYTPWGLPGSIEVGRIVCTIMFAAITGGKGKSQAPSKKKVTVSNSHSNP